MNLFTKDDDLCKHEKDHRVRHKIKNNEHVRENFFLDTIDIHGSYMSHCNAMKNKGIDPGAFKWFTVIRNPWDRMLSLYLYHKNVIMIYGKDFKTFALTHHDRHDFNSLVGFDNVDKIDYIVRFENFEEDLTKMFREVGVPEMDIPCLNSTNRSEGYRSYYDNESRKKVANRYSKEISEFGYEF
jgi:hypothetical protein